MTTPSGEMVAGVLAVLAQWERRMISERTKAKPTLHGLAAQPRFAPRRVLAK
jgi:hypothetical protein